MYDEINYVTSSEEDGNDADAARGARRKSRQSRSSAAGDEPPSEREHTHVEVSDSGESSDSVDHDFELVEPEVS